MEDFHIQILTDFILDCSLKSFNEKKLALVLTVPHFANLLTHYIERKYKVKEGVRRGRGRRAQLSEAEAEYERIKWRYIHKLYTKSLDTIATAVRPKIMIKKIASEIDR